MTGRVIWGKKSNLPVRLQLDMNISITMTHFRNISFDSETELSHLFKKCFKNYLPSFNTSFDTDFGKWWEETCNIKFNYLVICLHTSTIQIRQPFIWICLNITISNVGGIMWTTLCTDTNPAGQLQPSMAPQIIAIWSVIKPSITSSADLNCIRYRPSIYLSLKRMSGFTLNPDCCQHFHEYFALWWVLSSEQFNPFNWAV